MEFNRVWKFLAPSVAESGEHTKESVLDALLRGGRQLWVSNTSAVITEMLRYPSGLVAVSGWLAGGDLREIRAWLPMLEDWGRERGATLVKISGRRGWARAAGYREVRSVMVKDL